MLNLRKRRTFLQGVPGPWPHTGNGPTVRFMYGPGVVDINPLIKRLIANYSVQVHVIAVLQFSYMNYTMC